MQIGHDGYQTQWFDLFKCSELFVDLTQLPDVLLLLVVSAVGVPKSGCRIISVMIMKMTTAVTLSMVSYDSFLFYNQHSYRGENVELRIQHCYRSTKD